MGASSLYRVIVAPYLSAVAQLLRPVSCIFLLGDWVIILEILLSEDDEEQTRITVSDLYEGSYVRLDFRKFPCSSNFMRRTGIVFAGLVF